MKQRSIALLVLFFCTVLFLHDVHAQVKGVLQNTEGKALAFANIYIKGTTKGTSSNEDGYFELSIEKGTYILVFQHIGYSNKEELIDFDGTELTLNISLQALDYQLNELTVSSAAEDPAMAIMRKVIEKREEHLNEVKAYSCDVYIKGFQEITEAPDQIMGIKLSQFGILDSNNAGIVYLSESESTLFYEAPDNRKEIMYSSKVSGDNQAFSWNSASAMDFSFYENKMELEGLNERGFISPLADNAFFYYTYILEGSTIQDGREIDKIKVVPKRKNDPVFRGYVYIVEDEWRLFANELVLGKSAGIEFVDSLIFEASYVPVDDQRWRLLSQSFHFTFKLLGIKGQGYFTSVYRNYQLDPDFPKNFFGPEVMKIEEGANEKEEGYWKQARPIPLIETEIQDYQKKDSIAVLRKSKDYLDSLDRIGNKFSAFDVLTGYSYQNSYRKFELNTSPVTDLIQFNTVEGWNITMGIRMKKELERNRYYSFKPLFRYGFSNKHFNSTLGIDFLYNKPAAAKLEIDGGRMIAQYQAGSIQPMINSFHSLLGRKNYMKIYENFFVKIGHERELFNGIFNTLSVEYRDRMPLVNTSDYSFVSDEKRDYLSNNPLDPGNDEPAFERNQLFKFTIGFRFRFGQQYMREPHDKFVVNTPWPDIWVRYEKAIAGFGPSDIAYDKISGSIEDEVKLGLFGLSKFYIGGGKFLRTKNIEFIDFQHFAGNKTVLNLRPDVLNQFYLLDYYGHSTDNYWIEAHYEHHFNGFLFNKIPFIRKLKWQLLASGRYLYTPIQEHYWEIGVGIEHIFKVLRVDFAFGFEEPGDLNFGVVVGFGF